MVVFVLLAPPEHSEAPAFRVFTMSYPENQYLHIRDAWDDAHAAALSPLEALVYRSNRLGEDRRITCTGSGSTSLKVMETDPGNGKPVEVIWVKCTGADLRASSGSHFSPLYQEKLVALSSGHRPHAETDRTLTEQIQAATFNCAASAPSVDTPLHALMPYAHVNHLHPSSAIAVGACQNSKSLTAKIWGENMLWVPRARPGFEQGIPLLEAWNSRPGATAALLAGNGIATWSDDNRRCYQQTLDIVEAASRYIAAHDKGEQTFGGLRYTDLEDATRQTVLASVLLPLRELVSEGDLLTATVETGPDVMRFVNSVDAPRLVDKGVACLHHLRRTGLKPLYTAWDPQRETVETLEQRLQQEVAHYRESRGSYRKQTGIPGTDTGPRVCLIPGIGMIAWGSNQNDSRLTAEAYQNAIEVMRCAEAIDTYVGLPERDALAMERYYRSQPT